MRLKEDATTWRASSLLKRDFQHDHSEGAPTYRSHKPTNKWCRSKIGIRHTMNWHREQWLFGESIYVGTCDACGKRIYRKHVDLQQS